MDDDSEDEEEERKVAAVAVPMEEDQKEEEEEEEPEQILEQREKEDFVPFDLEPVPWPKPSPKDEFDFPCSFGEPEERDNPNLKKIQEWCGLFGQEKDYQLAVNIQKLYDDRFRYRKCGGKEWTLNSIRNHAFEDLPSSNEVQKKHMRRMTGRKMRILEKGGVASIDKKTGIVVLNMRPVDAYIKLTKSYMSIK